MKQPYVIMVWMMLLLSSVSSWAYDVVSESDTLRTDSISEPEWYVAPVIPASLRAPMRTSAAAASCKTDSVLTFNVDSVLTDVTVYEYDEASRTVGTLVWTCNTDGSRVGKSRTEDRYDASGIKTMTATYVWDNMTNDWKGNAKTEYTFENGKNTVTITFDWLNGDWLAKTRYNYAYDAAGREIEYIYYTRNAASMQLVPAKSRIREYNAAGKMTLEIQYTAHDGTGWYAGTKKEYDYDAAGNQTEYTYYGSLSNSNWIGSTHEVWTYNAANKTTYYEKQTWSNGVWDNSTKEIWAFNDQLGKQTMHEKYEWDNDDWSINLREILGYDEAGNNTLMENYSLTNNVWKGTKKEEYTYVGTNKTGTITYNWNADNNAFVYKTWSINNTAENPNEKCSYNWVNDAWVGTGTRKLTTKTGGKTTEVITQTWPSGSIVWVNKTCTKTIYVGDNKTQETYYDWSNDTWVGTKRTDYTFNADGINIMTHNAKWQNNAWEMTSMTRTDISDETIDGVHQISYTQWQCGEDSVWKGVQKDTTSYYITAENTQNPLYLASFSSMANNDWVPSYKIEHEYDEADREILNRRMDWVNNKWQGHYLYEYEYDDQGQQTAYTYYGDWNSSTNSWIGGSKYDYVYAANGQYAQKIMYKWQYDDNQWVGLFQYFYRYDDANHEIEQLVQSYSNGEWQNSQLYIHEYNGTLLIKNNEYRWRNEQWQYSRRNEKTYDEDAQSKLRRDITGSWNTNGVLSAFTDKLYFYACDLLRYHTIRFVNYDGTELSLESILEGETPSYNGTDPTKPADAQYTYTFAGWEPEVVAVVGDATYTAKFDSTKNNYTITWLNGDGSEIDHETLTYGTTPTHADINKESTAEYTYTFAGWTPGIGIVTGDASYTAIYTTTKNNYTITWKNEDGSVISTANVEYGQMPTAPTDPIKLDDGTNTYTFNGWTPEITAVTGDAEYTATFTATKKSYTITWKNEDGSIIESETLEYGATPAHANIYKESTAEWTYTFAGWSPEIVPVTGDATYTASFTATKNSYTITWKNEDGSIIESETLEYGATPAQADINKESTAEYTYTFAGWTPQITAVTGDAEYTATFTVTKNSYTITWLNDDGFEIDQETLEYGAMPTHADINKESTAEWTYTFAGWEPEIVAVVGDASYTAKFDSTKNTYTITFYSGYGTILEQMTVEYGQIPVCRYTPSLISDDFHHYDIFTGWTPEIVPATCDASYTPTFELVTRQYTITFRNYNGKELQSSKVDYGTMPEYTGETPERIGSYPYSYVFTGWDPELVPVSGDAVYKAIFEKVMNTYHIVFYDEDGITELDQKEVEYGIVPSTSVVPTKEDDDEYTYTFVGWQPKPVAATKDASYKASYKATFKTQGINGTEAGETATKVIIDHQIFIRRGGKTYTIDGQRVQ